MRLSSRGSDDADVIRARLRALLEEAHRPGGWLPDDPDDDGAWPELDDDTRRTVSVREPASVDESAADDDGRLPTGLGRHRAPDRALRWDPGRRGGRSLWIAGLIAALLVAAWTWLDRPQVEPAPTEQTSTDGAGRTPSTPPVGEAAESSATVIVSVVGLVNRPGLVSLPTGARVAAAIEAAGGLLPDADPASVNLAAVVTDGEQIAVGTPGAVAPGGDGAATGAAPGALVDLNTAGVAELDALPGIGPVLAQRIVDYRSKEGPFTSVDQLDDVPGIGPAIFTDLAERVRV